MVMIKKSLPELLIGQYFDDLRSEIQAEASKLLTPELQYTNPEKFMEEKANQNYLIGRLALPEQNCYDKHLIELEQNGVNLDEPDKDRILRGLFANEQFIFVANVGIGLGMVLRINEYMPKNGLDLIKRELTKFDPSKSLSDNTSDIFKGIQFKSLTPKTLLTWFLLNNLYKHIFECQENINLGDPSKHQLYHEINLKQFYNLFEIQYISKNYREIPSLCFNDSYVRLSQLRKLNIMWTGVTKIDPQAFSTCHNLESLNLEGNKLEQIDPQWFTPLFNLTELKLSNNQLTKVAPKTFQNLSSLEHLELFGIYNDFKYEKGIFEGLTNLKTLSLAGCHELKPDMFDSLINLTSLGLDGFFRDTKLFDNDYFKCLVNLDYLLIQNSGAGTLGANFLSAQLNMKNLTLQDCPIKVIDPKAFRHLKQLEGIWIMNAGLDSVDNGWFKGLKKLTKIDLSYNKFDEGHVFRFDEQDCDVMNL